MLSKKISGHPQSSEYGGSDLQIVRTRNVEDRFKLCVKFFREYHFDITLPGPQHLIPCSVTQICAIFSEYHNGFIATLCYNMTLLLGL